MKSKVQLMCWVALAALVAMPGGGAAKTTDPGSADEVRELAERMMGPLPLGPGAQPITAHLLVGSIPMGLPVGIATPSGGRLLGSMARYSGETLVGATALLDVPGSPAQLLAFYDEDLAAQGWTSAGSPPTGLQPTLVSVTQSYCRGDDPASPSVNVTLVPRLGGRYDVRFAEDTLFSVCGRFQQFPPGLFRLLPPLYPPTGVELMPSNPQQPLGGGKPALQTSQGILVSSMDIADVERHFGEQLQSAGWSRIDGGVAGPAAWSTWSIPVEGQWLGLFFVLDGPGPDQRTIQVQVATASAPPSVASFPPVAFPR
ncbi:MAG TPA: hypothetical protein VGK54_03710 [Chloroflexota bacterium]